MMVIQKPDQNYGYDKIENEPGYQVVKIRWIKNFNVQELEGQGKRIKNSVTA
jgi:hypothetical protein